MMKTNEIKLDPYGDVDVAYYVELAKKERRAAISALFGELAASIRSLLHVKSHNVKSHKMAGSH